MVITYKVNEVVELVRQAAKSSGPSRSMLIYKAKEIVDDLELIQVADLQEEVGKLTPMELRIVMALGAPKQIYNKAARMLAGQDPIQNA